MTETIVTAIITGLLAVAGSYVGNVAISRKKSQEDAVRDAKRETRQQVRLESIERKLDIHNGYAEKIGDVQRDISKLQKDVEWLRGEKGRA